VAPLSSFRNLTSNDFMTFPLRSWTAGAPLIYSPGSYGEKPKVV
jgi:hypothetical protein